MFRAFVPADLFRLAATFVVLSEVGCEASNEVGESAVKIASCTISRLVILSAAKDLQLHFHDFEWNTDPCPTAVDSIDGYRLKFSFTPIIAQAHILDLT
jgi:hypothetical protein